MVFKPTQDDGELVDYLARYYDDPLGCVMAVYPWRQPGTILADEDGPDKWQAEYLENLGKEIRECDAGLKEIIQIATASGHGPGKFLHNNELVYTPQGTCEIGKLKVGDMVLGGDGQPCRVIGVYPQGNQPLYRIRFSDKSSVLAGLEHLWSVTTKTGRAKRLGYQVTDTQKIKNNLSRSYMIPMTSAVHFVERHLLIDPYIMGYVLGNGSVCTPGAVKISCYEDGIYERITERLPVGYSLNGKTSDGHYKHISSGSYANNYNVVYRAIQGYDLAGKKAQDKFIPEDYLYNTIEKRIDLLRGLMDADGCISPRKGRKNGWRCVFSTSSGKMRDQMIWLIQSLGGVAGYSSDDRRGRKSFIGDKKIPSVVRHINYQLAINLPNSIMPFYAPRKAAMYKQWIANGRKEEPKRFIRSVEYEEDAESCCISVDSPNGLYLTKDFIVTHNTALCAWIIHWFLTTRPDAHAVATANTGMQLSDKTWRELAKWHKLAINGHHFEWTATSYRFIPRYKTQYAAAIPWSEHNSEAFAGLHEKYVLVLYDEASAVANIIWDVTAGAMTTRGAMWLVFGNMTRASGKFHDCFHSNRERWTRFSIDSRTAKKANKKLLDQWVEDYGEDSDFVRVRVRGLPPKLATLQFIPTNLVEDALKREHPLKVYAHAAKVLAADIAREGDDSTVLCLRQGLKLLWMKQYRGLDIMECAQIVAEWEDKETPDAVFIDAVNIGAGVIDRGRQLGRQWIEHKGSHKSSRREMANKRAECWYDMRKWLEDADLTVVNTSDQRQVVVDDLTGIEYCYDRIDRIQMEKKSDMKSRGLHSPDHGDALAMTFSQRVIPKRQIQDEYDYREAERLRHREDKSRNLITGY